MCVRPRWLKSSWEFPCASHLTQSRRLWFKDGQGFCGHPSIPLGSPLLAMMVAMVSLHWPVKYFVKITVNWSLTNKILCKKCNWSVTSKILCEKRNWSLTSKILHEKCNWSLTSKILCKKYNWSWTSKILCEKPNSSNVPFWWFSTVMYQLHLWLLTCHHLLTDWQMSFSQSVPVYRHTSLDKSARCLSMIVMSTEHVPTCRFWKQWSQQWTLGLCSFKREFCFSKWVHGAFWSVSAWRRQLCWWWRGLL